MAEKEVIHVPGLSEAALIAAHSGTFAASRRRAALRQLWRGLAHHCGRRVDAGEALDDHRHVVLDLLANSL